MSNSRLCPCAKENPLKPDVETAPSELLLHLRSASIYSILSRPVFNLSPPFVFVAPSLIPPYLRLHYMHLCSETEPQRFLSSLRKILGWRDSNFIDPSARFPEPEPQPQPQPGPGNGGWRLEDEAGGGGSAAGGQQWGVFPCRSVWINSEKCDDGQTRLNLPGGCEQKKTHIRTKTLLLFLW